MMTGGRSEIRLTEVIFTSIARVFCLAGKVSLPLHSSYPLYKIEQFVPLHEQGDLKLTMFV
jgi:hypothetical protein